MLTCFSECLRDLTNSHGVSRIHSFRIKTLSTKSILLNSFSKITAVLPKMFWRRYTNFHKHFFPGTRLAEISRSAFIRTDTSYHSPRASHVCFRAFRQSDFIPPTNRKLSENKFNTCLDCVSRRPIVLGSFIFQCHKKTLLSVDVIIRVIIASYKYLRQKTLPLGSYRDLYS